MTWLAWRQMRTQFVVATVLAVCVSVVFVATRGTVVGAADPGALSGSYQSMRLFGTGLIALPALIGAFWGAPLVAHELEAGTFRLAWTQSVTRSRWLIVKLAYAVVGTVLVTGLCTLAFTWWSIGFDRVGNRIGTANFGQRGIVPIAYAVFALVLGVLLGMVWRRTLPAMAASAAAFMVVRYLVQLVRPHLMATVVASRSVDAFGTGSSPATKGAWILSTHTVDAAGHVVGQRTLENRITALCHLRSHRVGVPELAACAKRAGFHDVVTMHPTNHFWALQTIEAAIFLTLAGIVAGLCFWWIRSRLT